MRHSSWHGRGSLRLAAPLVDQGERRAVEGRFTGRSPVLKARFTSEDGPDPTMRLGGYGRVRDERGGASDDKKGTDRIQRVASRAPEL